MFIHHRLQPHKERPLICYTVYSDAVGTSDMLDFDDATNLNLTLTFPASARLRVMQELERIVKEMDNQIGKEEEESKAAQAEKELAEEALYDNRI